MLVAITRHEIKQKLTSFVWSINYRPKSPKTQFLSMLASRNLAGLLILKLEIEPEELRSITQILAMTQTNL